MTRRIWTIAGAIIAVCLIIGIIWLEIWPVKRIPTIAVILPTISNPFWLEVKRGAEDALTPTVGRKVQVVVKAGSADADARGQNDLLSAYVAKGTADAIVLGPASASEPIPFVEQLNQKAVPVVVIDSRLDPKAMVQHSAHMDAFIGSNNVQGGELAAQEIARLIGDGPRTILLIKGSPVHETAIDRAEGFMRAKPKNWKVDEEIADWRSDVAQQKTSVYLNKSIPDAIFVSSDEMAMGVIRAIEFKGLKKNKWPLIIGFDATEAGLKAIVEGKMHATIKQKAYEMGKLGVETAWALINKEPIVKNMPLGVDLITGSEIK